MIRRLGGGRRAGLVLIDQGLSSAAGFLLMVTAVRVLPAADFAVFSLLYSGYLLAMVSIRGTTGDVAAISPVDRAANCRLAATTAYALASVVGLAALVVGLAIGSTGLAATGAILPLLLGQDALRWGSVVIYRPQLAVRVDAACLLALGVGSAILLARPDRPGVGAVVAVWGISAGAAVLVGLVTTADLRPAPVSPLVWLRAGRRHGKYFSAEALAQNGLNTLTTSLIAVVAGLHELALFKGAQLVYGPVSLLLQAGGTFLVSESVRSVGERPSRFRRRNTRSATALAAAVAAVTVVVSIVPAGLLSAVFGETAEQARPLLPWMGVTFVLTTIVQVRQSGMRALRRSRLAFGCRIGGVAVIDAALLAGAVWNGGLGAVQVGCAGYAVAALASHTGFRVANRGDRTHVAPTASARPVGLAGAR